MSHVLLALTAFFLLLGLIAIAFAYTRNVPVTLSALALLLLATALLTL